MKLRLRLTPKWLKSRAIQIAGRLLLLLAGTGLAALAYPPAPYHVIYGLVRDQYGTPLLTSQIQILLQTSSGIRLQTPVSPGLAPGVNYQIQVPMDAGLTSVPYRATALAVSASFKIYFVSGGTTNAPIQMTGDYSHLGKPGQSTRIDLTMGIDANRDGIPDAWEYAFLDQLGTNLSLSDLHAGLDLAHDGRTLLQEYLLGNYPFDPGSAFTVKLISVRAGAPVLEFNTMTGRSYTVMGSPDLAQWTPLSFREAADNSTGPTRSFYAATKIETVQVQVVLPAPGPNPPRFFKILLQ